MPTSVGSRSIDPVNVSKENKEENMPNLNETQSQNSKENKENNVPNLNDNQNDTTSYQAALEARRERLAAMPEARINRRIRLDVPFATTVARAAVHTAGELRGDLVAQFGPFAAQILDGLDTTAKAARQAWNDHERQEEGVQLAPMHREIVAMHERLFVDAESLAIRGHLSRASVASHRDPRSYQGALDAVIGLASLLRENWSAIAAHTPITPDVLDAAEEIADRFGKALAAGPQGSGRTSALETRLRALSLLVREYEELRRMVLFIRHFEGDAQRFVPSLYSGRRSRKGKESEDEDLGGDDDAFVTPGGPAVPVHGGPAFPINGGPAFPNG